MRSIAAAVFAVLAFLALPARAAEPLVIFDAHLHYNDDAVVQYPVEQVLRLFRDNGVRGILANSRPNDGTHKLLDVAKGGDLWVVPFLRPYRVRADRNTWFKDPAILAWLQEELKRGGYQGIGEFHLHGAEDASGAQVKRIVELARENGLWLHAHSDEAAVEALFRHDPKARIVWAHTGFSTAPETVERMLAEHPTLVGELSYRGGLTDGEGRLLPAWRRLFTERADRFLLGSDTWVLERWESYPGTMSGYRQWLEQLPEAAARQIAFGNAERLFPR